MQRVIDGGKHQRATVPPAINHFVKYCKCERYTVPHHPSLDSLENDVTSDGRIGDFIRWLHEANPDLAGSTVAQYVSTVRARVREAVNWEFRYSFRVSAYLMTQKRPVMRCCFCSFSQSWLQVMYSTKGFKTATVPSTSS